MYLIPSCKVRLAIRFDEMGAHRDLKTKADAQNATATTKNLSGVKVERGDLKLVQDGDAPPGVSRLILLSSSSVSQIQSNQPNALQQDKGGFLRIANSIPQRSQDKLTYDVLLIPTEATWKKNGIREADHLTVKFPYSQFPFDPRLVRSVAMELIMGCVKPEDYEAGVNGEYRTLPDGSQELRSVVPDTYTDNQGRPRTNTRFQGFCDTWENEWPTDGEPMVTLEGRDNTQLIIDQTVSPRLVVDMNKPIHEAVAQYLSHFPQCEGLSVEYLPPGETPPVLSKVLANTAFRPQLGPQPSKGGQDLKAWDYLTDIVGAVGHSIRLDGTRVIIQRVRSFMTSASVRRPDDPYTGRTGPAGERLEWRRFLWGRNIASLKTKRTFTPTRSPVNIEVRIYNHATKQLIVGRFPEDHDRQVYAIPGDASPDQKWEVRRIGYAGIKDAKTAKLIAQELYESQGRNELEVELHTDDLASYAGSDDDPDILDATAGDTIEVMTAEAAADERDNEQVTLAGVLASSSRARQHIKNLGFTDEFADAFAQASANSAFVQQFRLKELESKWTIGDGGGGGIELTVAGTNYQEVRSDKVGLDEPDNNPGLPPLPGPNAGPPANLPAPSGSPSGWI